VSDDSKLERLLRQAYAPTPQVQGDLWPAMERRMLSPPRRVHWSEWAMIVAALALLGATPSIVPLLLYWW
jgi:hypothetical protein